MVIGENADKIIVNGNVLAHMNEPCITFFVYGINEQEFHYIYDESSGEHTKLRLKMKDLGIFDKGHITYAVRGRIWPKKKIAGVYQDIWETMDFADQIEKMFQELHLDITEFGWDFGIEEDTGLKDWIRQPKNHTPTSLTTNEKAIKKEIDELITQMHVAPPGEKEKLRAKIRTLQNSIGMEDKELESYVRASYEKFKQIAGQHNSLAKANFYKGPIAEDSFKVYRGNQDPNLWLDGMTLRPEIRAVLLKVAQDFYKSTDLQISIIDILVIGSAANFNWTPTSDIDLHLVVDATQIKVAPELVRSFMDGLGAKWNNNHEIEIKGHPVEAYMQDVKEHNSTAENAREGTAVYSILRNQWVKKPEQKKPSIDKGKIVAKYHKLKDKINSFINEKDVDKLKDLMKNIRNYRDAGLTKSGEFSTENLVFKALRYSGDLTKLKDAINSLYDKSVTINESCQVANSTSKKPSGWNSSHSVA
jgi:hypothetical protein